MSKLLMEANKLVSTPMDIPSFAFPVEPRPGEGVPDLLMRATFENGFSGMRAINLMLGYAENTQWSHSAMTARTIDAVAIATILGVREERIQELLYGRQPGPINFFGAKISPFSFGRARKVSPTYLKQKGYQKAIWGLRCFSFDPDNRERLVDQCSCGARLTFERSAVLASCNYCGADLRELETSNVDIADEAALQFFLSLIDPCADRSMQWNIDDGLRQFSRGELFTLIVDSAKLLNLQATGRKDTKLGENYIIPHDFILEAANSVLNWPNGFLDMAISIEDSRVTNCRRSKTHPVVASIPRNFKDLRRFLRKELNILFGRGKRVRFHYPGTSIAEGDHPPIFYPKAVKLQGKELGLPLCEVLNLYQIGSVQCPDRSLGLLLGAPANAPLLNTESFKRRPSVEARGLPIFELVHASRSSKHPWAQVFAAILNGEIKVRWQPSKGNSNWFSKCLFTTDEARVRKICQSRGSTLSPDTEISIDDLLFYFRMMRTSRAILRGARVIPRGRLTLKILWGLQERYMTFQDIKAHLFVNGMRQFPSILGRDLDSSGLRRIVPEVRLYERGEAEAYLRAFRPGVRSV
ncbi:hypothetical protein [Rhizobium sp. SG741]|uniref:hypothetical protein n=1 Tax=Rhizobium sp. SG741 TaxID=2587114 RepID=UPI001447224B|nr:hypothetical protein [Rhizobium sp. SG741]NKJ07966.1 hypothetical protein [Rhizobium sp. SG741]